MCNAEPHCRFNNPVEKMALVGKLYTKSGCFRWHYIVFSEKIHMYFKLSQDKKRFSHKDLLTLHQSLTSLRIMAKLNRLKAVLAEQDKTSKWLAEQVGKSACTVSKWCNNVVQPDLNTLDKIAKLLDVDVKDLLNSTEK